MSTNDLFERFPTARSAPAGSRPGRKGMWMRRVGIIVLAALVVTGLLGYLGPSPRTASTTAAAGTLDMTYDAITRPGVDSEVAVTVRLQRPADSLVLAIDQDILKTYGIELFTPEPVEQRAENGKVVLEFATAGGDTFDVTLSGRTPTTQSPGRTPWQLQWRSDGSPAVTLDATTWVVP